MTQAELERAAVEAHNRGEAWASFWARVGDEVRRAEPWNAQRYRRLFHKLLALLTSGDDDGTYPPGDDAPWETDDRTDGLGVVSDTETAARLQQHTFWDTNAPYT